MKVRLKIYRGYANEQEIIIFGHLFKKYAPDRFALDGKRFRHAYSVIRMFSIKTLGNVPVRLKFRGIDLKTRTLEDGYFRFAVRYTMDLECGWHEFTVSTDSDGTSIEGKGEFVKPYPGRFGLISDIDDTFLISHSSNFLKKIYILLTRNIDKRNIFEGVVNHYRLLSNAGRTKDGKTNAFFYVSSSEWNLYNFIEKFTFLHGLPKAVLKLRKIKTGLGDFLFTGGGSHDHKFDKVKHLIEFYKELKFVLLGDDSQKDSEIYRRIVKMFPTNVTAVYIRCTKKELKSEVIRSMTDITDEGVATCYFQHSSEAIEHSKSIGLI
ncbi:App1 family protein [Pricia sp.]|uniref:App1 family protein n=1 Tax=Pricia sp. TaxID=2268138 RepID=UPI0035947EC1